MAGEAASRKSLTVAFQKRQDLELRKLREHLHEQLQQDIARIYSNSLYCDLELVFNTTTIHTHSSILKVRAEKFFTKLHAIPSLTSLQDGLQSISFEKRPVECIKNFIRDIYSKCTISEEEKNAVQCLEEISEQVYGNTPTTKRNNSFDTVLSPESDIFLTPNCSPSELYPQSENQKPLGSFVLDESYMKTVESKKDVSVVNLHKTNQSYYSIVPVDEIFVCSDSVPKLQCTILEKELEEQDELLKSFQSIKSKENNKSTPRKLKKPTSLPFLSSQLTKKQKRGCDFTSREHFLKNNKRTVDSRQDKISHNCRKTELKNSLNSKVNCETSGPSCVQCETKDKLIKEDEEREQEESEVRKNSKVNFTLQFSDEKFINTFVDNTAEDEEFMCSPIEVVDSVLECCKRRETTEDLPYFSCSPEMDASGGGPDSGLDTSSTGCVPAGGFSSPREHTVSETSGVDLTEAAIGEDMPHDGDDGGLVARPVKSSASSSVSSEAGTWDSTFPPSNSDNGQEQNTEDKTNTDSVKTLRANKKQESEYFLEERSKDCEAEHEKCDHGFGVHVSAPVQEKSCISQHTNNGVNVLPLPITSVTNISLQTKSDENLGNLDELKISASGLVNEKQSDFCDKHSEKHDNDEVEKIEDREVKEETNQNAPEDEVSDTEGKLKDEFGANYVETKFVPGLYSSYNERCNDWWLEPSPHSSLGSQNYFIDAASLVDDSEVSLPPFQMSKSDQVLKDSKESELPIREAVTATPHTSPVSERSKLSCITASDSGSVNTQALPVSQDLNSVKTEEENLLESDFTFVQSHKEAADKPSEDLKDAPELVQPKYTHLKPSAMRLDGQDNYAEFEKELKLSEYLAPQTTLQKLHREGMRRRWDSCSEEMLGGSSRQFDTIDGLTEVCKSDLNIIHTVSVEDHKGKDNEHEQAICSSLQRLVQLERESLAKDSSHEKAFSDIEPVTKTPIGLESEFDRQKQHSHISWHGDNLKQEIQKTTDIKTDNSADNVKVPENPDLKHKDSGTKVEQLDGDAVTMAMADKSNTPTEAEPRPSLIRRNTFELDTDDEHLALLRQEYERRQGNLVFQSHIPQFSGHITGNEGFRDPQSLIMVGSDLTAEGIMTEYMQASHISAPSSLLFESSKLIANIDHTLNVPVPAALSNAPVVTDESYFVDPSTQIHSGEVKELDELRELTFTDAIKIEPYSEVPVVELDVSKDLMPHYTNDYNKYCESVPSLDQKLLNSDGLSNDLAALSQTDKDTEKYAAINYDTNSKPVVSGALTFSDIIEEKKSWDSPKKQKRTESTPIISGGVSTIDFSVKPRKVNDSPVLSRRRNELAPILSGAAPALPETNVDTIDTQPPKNVPAKSAWVVDMSDCAVTVAKKPPLDSRRRRKSDITMTPSKNLTEAVEQNQSVKSKEESNGFVLELKESASQGHGLNLKSSEVLPKENKIQKSASASSVKSCGLGYFVDLSEPKSGKSERKVSNSTEGKVRSLKSNAQEGKSCGYFVGLGKDELSQKKEGHSIVKQHSADEIKDVSSEKKNLMFSMFIDISAPKQETHPDMNGIDVKDLSPSSLKRKTLQSMKTEDASKSGKQNRIAGTTFDVGDEKQNSAKGTYMYIDASLPSSETEHPAPVIDKTVKEMPEKKQAVFMFIESDSPVTRRKTLPSGLRPNFNRHSWNPETEERAVSRKQHKRAHSLSVDRSSLSTSSEEKSSSASSLSKSRLQSSSQSLSEDSHIVKQMSSSCHGRLMSKTYEKFVKRSLSSEGNSESEINTITEEKNYSEKMQQKSSEALFVALEEADSKEIDSIVDTDMSNQKVPSVIENKVYRHRRLAKVESENTVSEKNISSSSRGSDVECSSGSGDKRLPEKLPNQESCLQTEKQQELGSEVTNKSFTVESTNSMNAAKVEFLESEAKSAGSGSFVKLSDLDREPETKPESCSVDSLPSLSSTGRMTRSIPETSWIENKLLMTRSIGSGTTSKSLGRLFPHLHSTTASNSSPKTGHSKSPSSGQLEAEDNETQVSETSDLSSMQSSMGPSGLEGSTEETDASSSCAGRSAPVSRLGEDLLRMFLEEINPDVTVEVGGRRMKAHKCILSSRCQYFAAMLSGGWVESAGNVISLQGFSYNAVHFALCHIYSGASNIPDSISIVELATLADMLGLEGLKEVIMYTLKVKYCHFFHKPCSMCAVGVLECLPLAAAYGLDDIYRKSLKWITKHFVKIWPTKGFASLPRELIDKCFQQHVVHMTTDNVLETVTSCDKLLAIIPNVRWAEPVFSLTSQLLEACIKFVAHHFSGVLTSDSFLSLAKDSNWNISQLEDSLMAATDRLPPDQACQSYAHLHHILNAAKSSESQPEVPWSSCFLELLERLQKRVEVSLVRQAPRAARSPSWLLMEPELQRRIQEAACLVLMPSDEAHRSRHVSLSARHSSTSSSGSRSLDLRQVKLAMTQQARRTASGGRVSTLRADSSNASRRQQQQQPVQQSHQLRQHSAASGAHPPKNGEVKTQESKQKLPKQKNQSASCAATPEKLTTTTRRPGRTISSSDSSRTSSPAMRRSAPGSDSSGKSRTFTAGSVPRGVSGTSPGRDAKGRKKKDGEFSMSADSLSELTTNSAKVQLKETNDVTKSKNRCSVPAEALLVKKRVGDEITISTDSLSESAAIPERLKGQEATSQSAPNATRPDTPKERRHALGRIGTDVTMSTDSLATAESFSVDSVASKTQNGKTVTSTSQGGSSKHDVNRTPTAKGVKGGSTRMENQQSPLPAIRKLTNRQTVLSPRDSPTARLRSGATSSPYSSSPSLRRNVLISARPTPDNASSINNNSKSAAPTKAVVQMKSERGSVRANSSSSTATASSNRRTPPRLQGKNQLSSPAKASSENKTSGTRSALRDAGGTFTLSKTVINVNKVNNNALKKTVNGVLSRSKCVTECVTQTKTKVETKKGGPLEDKPPSVGSRSGTFLKDEPTILKKPDVDNVQE